MALDTKYGQIEIPGVPDDMPVFILLAKDAFAVPTIARYRNFAAAIEDVDEQRSDEWMKGVDAEVERFSTWQAKNKDQVKLPD